jgi:hypothetical protein
MRLGDSITGSITSVSIGNPLNTVNSAQRRQHSNVFLAANFNGVNLITSLRYLSKHDNSIPVFNRFGSLLHVPMSYFSSLRILDADLRLGNKDSIPVEDSQNRVSVRGRRIALNEEILVTMDDRSRQQGRFDNDVVENITPVFDASITSMQQARRVARKMLKANSAMQGRIETNGHPYAFDLRPGDVVMYDGQKHVIIEATHKMARSVSDFVFTSVKSGMLYPVAMLTLPLEKFTRPFRLKIGLASFHILRYGLLLFLLSYSYASPASHAGLIPNPRTGARLTSSPRSLPHQSTK